MATEKPKLTLEDIEKLRQGVLDPWAPKVFDPTYEHPENYRMVTEMIWFALLDHAEAHLRQQAAEVEELLTRDVPFDAALGDKSVSRKMLASPSQAGLRVWEEASASDDTNRSNDDD